MLSIALHRGAVPKQRSPPKASLKIDAIAPSGNALSAAADRPLLRPKLSSRASAASLALPPGAPASQGGAQKKPKRLEQSRKKAPGAPLLGGREAPPRATLLLSAREA